MNSSIPGLLVFDLDGTLIDSRLDLCNSVNATLVHLGKPELPHEVIAGYIGDGASMLVRRSLGESGGDAAGEEYVTQALAYFLEFYRKHKLDHTYVYPGVMDALRSIHKANPDLPMAVLTNKPVNPSREICAYFGLNRFFFQNYGGNSFRTKKPDPQGLLTLIGEASALIGHSVTPQRTVMIGDSDIDILTARNCGAQSIGCTFGLAPHTLEAASPTYTAESSEDWPLLLRHWPSLLRV